MTPKERFLNALRRNREQLQTNRMSNQPGDIEAFSCAIYEKGMLDAAVLLGVIDREEAARLKTPNRGAKGTLPYEVAHKS